MLLFHEKNIVAQFLTSKITRKMARNRMNENYENWQCGVCEISGLLKRSEYQFWTWIWKPQIGNPQKTDCFQFSVNLFLSNCWFDYLVLYKPQQRNLEFWTYFSQSFLFFAQQQKRVFKPSFLNPSFQNSGSNPTWFWKPEKVPFQTWKRPFLVYFKKGQWLISA